VFKKKGENAFLASAKSFRAADMHMYQIAPAAGRPKGLGPITEAPSYCSQGWPMKLYAVRIGAIASDGECYTDTLTKAPQ